MEKKHSQLPWKLKEGSETLIQAGVIEIKQVVDIRDMASKEDQERVVFNLCPTNAQFIIKACNNHYSLLEALEGLLDLIYDQDKFVDPRIDNAEKILEAIKNCEGK